MSIKPPRNQPLILDTNVAVLFFVGTAGPELVGKHQRLGQYDLDDFKLVQEIAMNASNLIVSPYIATEVSNLALDKRNIGQSARLRIAKVFREHLVSAAEFYSSCAASASDEKFHELGLADSALLLALKSNRKLNLLTDDWRLSQIGLSRKLRVFNFSHVRNQREDFQP